MHACLLSCFSLVQLFMTLWTAALQAPLTMEFSRPEYWSGWPIPSPVDLCKPGIKPGSSALQGDSLPAQPPGKPCRVTVITHRAEEDEEQRKTGPRNRFVVSASPRMVGTMCSCSRNSLLLHQKEKQSVCNHINLASTAH